MLRLENLGGREVWFNARARLRNSLICSGPPQNNAYETRSAKIDQTDPNQVLSGHARDALQLLQRHHSHRTCTIYMLANSTVHTFSISEFNIWLILHISTHVLLNFYLSLCSNICLISCFFLYTFYVN